MWWTIMSALWKNELHLKPLKVDPMQDMSYLESPGDDLGDQRSKEKSPKLKDQKSPQFSSFRFWSQDWFSYSISQ